MGGGQLQTVNMVDINLMSTITLTVNDLNTPIKREWKNGWKNNSFCAARGTINKVKQQSTEVGGGDLQITYLKRDLPLEYIIKDKPITSG